MSNVNRTALNAVKSSRVACLIGGFLLILKHHLTEKVFLLMNIRGALPYHFRSVDSVGTEPRRIDLEAKKVVIGVDMVLQNVWQHPATA